MIYELVYTSARHGLKTGSHGFCTVAQTDGMSTAHVQLAESLSGYRNLYQPHDPNYTKNPIAFSHYVATVGGEQLSVLSRVAAYGTDYSGRTNKLAHHVIVPAAERPPGGPGSLVLDPGFFLTEWKEDPCVLTPGKAMPPVAETSYAAGLWQAACGDAGWAGVLAQTFLDAPGKDSYIVFSPGAELLPLLCEALRLLPPAERWRVTFSTYFSSCPRTSSCLWRCCLSGSDAHRALRSRRDALVIDLVKGVGALPLEGELVECARSGKAPAWAAAKPARPSVRRPVRGLAVKPEAEEPEHEPLARHVPRKKAVVKHSRGPLARRRPAARHATGVPIPLVLAGVALIAAVCGVAGWLVFGRRPSPAPRSQPVRPEQPGVPAQPAPLVRDEDPKIPTNAVADKEPEDHGAVPPPGEPDEPSKPEWDIAADAELLVRTRALRRPSPPWQIELPSWEDWGTSEYTFHTRTAPLVLEAPWKDVDRLKNQVRGLVYDAPGPGLRASVVQGKITIERLPGGNADGAMGGPYAVRVRSAGGSDRLVWTRGIVVRDGRLRDRRLAGPEVRIPLDATLALLVGSMRPERITCMAGFEGTELRRPIPYEVRVERDELVVMLGLDEAERERIRTVIAWKQGQKPAPAPTPEARKPRLARAEHLLDYDKLSDLLEGARLNAGTTTSVMSTVKRKIVMKALRTLVVDHCETPLARAGAKHPDAAYVSERLDALMQLVEDGMMDLSSLRRGSGDRMRLGGDGLGEVVRRSAVDRAAFFKGVFLPSNRRVTSGLLYDIVHSDELDELVNPPSSRPVGDFTVEEDPDEPAEPEPAPVEVIISELTFHPRDASWESLLAIRFTEADPL